ncbi:hypothetical protein CANCADRAFT_147963 [Tortispora caseinolytica NRRL Y-17796]|uniref:NADP-dependent oxidoreductase domain-containing protein n=1 Tax=Tortispora caseinolytica NRRL Y-17796 TaxID=767744 RepID=A0A1E4TF31_9ASCO|nr:hypothetical protein CANCADRAFT_147963 [Tortispora caseinolytica NRRL Y-17796]
MTLPEKELPSGVTIPLVGYGVGTRWFKGYDNNAADKLDESLVESIVNAIENGLTHLDTAEMYGTDKEVGEAIKRSGITRDKLFVTGKLLNGRADPEAAVNASLSRLGLGYFDLYLIHFPSDNKDISDVDTWKTLVSLKKAGKLRAIGVSNFTTSQIEPLLKLEQETGDPDYHPDVNQIEFNPYLTAQTPDIVPFCKENNIQVEAYHPLGPIVHPPTGSDPLKPVLEELSAKYGKTPAQILLKWTIAVGVVPVSTSSKSSRQKEYADIFDFDLDTEDVNLITSTGKQVTVRIYAKQLYDKYPGH